MDNRYKDMEITVMEYIVLNSELHIAKDALKEFLKPILKIAGFIKYLSLAKSHHEMLVEKIEKIEYELSQNNYYALVASQTTDLRNKKYLALIEGLEDEFKKAKDIVAKQRDYLHKLENFALDMQCLVYEGPKRITPSFFTSNQRLLSDHEVAIADINKGIHELTKYCYRVQPDYIVGLNRGGVMVGAYIALSMGIPSRNFLRCCVTANGDDVEVDCVFERLSGSVVIVDSITRTGSTMNYAVSNIRDYYPDIESLHAISIVASVDEDGVPLCEALNFAVFMTKKKNITLPWTAQKVIEEGPERAKHIKEEYLKVNDKNIGDIVTDIYSDFEKT